MEEPPGPNCPNGGSKITDGEGNVTYVCNGADGADGTNGTNGTDGTGTPGADGTDGVSAFTVTTANFTQPAELANVTIEVANSTWVAQGEVIFVSGGGYYGVVTVPDATHITLTNLEDTPNGAYPDNVAPGTVISAGAAVSPGGVQGPRGPQGTPGTPSVTGSCAFRADKNGVAQTQAAGGLGTDVTFDTERFDPDGVYDPGSSIWTCPVTGIYWFEAQLGMATVDGTGYILSLYKNGSFGSGTQIAVFAAGNNLIDTFNVTTGPIALAAGDTVQVHNFQTGGSPASISGATSGTWFGGFRIA